MNRGLKEQLEETGIAEKLYAERLEKFKQDLLTCVWPHKAKSYDELYRAMSTNQSLWDRAVSFGRIGVDLYRRAMHQHVPNPGADRRKFIDKQKQRKAMNKPKAQG